MKIENLNPGSGVAAMLYHTFLAYQPPEIGLGSGSIEPPVIEPSPREETKKYTRTYSTGAMSVVVSEVRSIDSARALTFMNA